MNILYATRAAIPYPSAASLNVVQMCQSLVQLKHHVKLAVGRKPWRRSTRVLDWQQFYGFQPDFGICRFLEFPKTGYWFDRQIASTARRDGALTYLRFARALPMLYALDVPVILEIHSALDARQAPAVGRGLRSGQLCGVVVLTREAKRQVCQAVHLDHEDPRIVVAADAVHPERFTDVSSAHQSADLGYVGSLYPGKGHEVVAKIAQHLTRSKVHVVGGPAALSRHFAQIAPANLLYHGYQYPALIPEFMQCFGIALLPNQPDVHLPNGTNIGRYTSPMKAFEYMAAGKAIVASDLPNLREVLDNERTALLVPHDDIDAWVAAVIRLQDDEQLRRRLSANARNAARERFSYRQRFRHIFRQLAAVRGEFLGELCV